MSSFAKNLAYYRKAIGINQTELAEKIGITAGQVSKYERGYAEPRPDILKKIAIALNIDTKKLLVEYKENQGNDIGGLIEAPLLEELAPLRGGKYKVDYTGKITINVGDDTLKVLDIIHENVICTKVKGNLMLPLFSNGAIVAIDTGNKTIVDGDIYVYILHKDGHQMLNISSLERLDNNKICSRPINKNHHKILLDNNDVKIVGAVFWYSSILTPTQSLMFKYLN